LTVKESEVFYNESVFFDASTQDVISEVPRHERDGSTFLEILKVDNFYLGYSVWREEFGDHCFFRMLMKFERPLILKRVTDEAEAKNEVIDQMKLEQVMLWATPEGNITSEERDLLTTDMKALCHDLPIIRMKTEKVHPEIFEQKMQDAGDCFVFQSGRKKRMARMALRSCTTCGCGGHDDLGGHELEPEEGYERSSKNELDQNQHDFTIRSRNDLNGSGEDMANQSEVNWKNNLVHLIIGHMDIGCR